MGIIAKDIPMLIQMLLPGFIAAGVFFTLTAHPKLSEFERLIQALIFTSILRVLTISIRAIFLFAGAHLGSLGLRIRDRTRRGPGDRGGFACGPDHAKGVGAGGAGRVGRRPDRDLGLARRFSLPRPAVA